MPLVKIAAIRRAEASGATSCWWVHDRRSGVLTLKGALTSGTGAEPRSPVEDGDQRKRTVTNWRSSTTICR